MKQKNVSHQQQQYKQDDRGSRLGNNAQIEKFSQEYTAVSRKPIDHRSRVSGESNRLVDEILASEAN